MRFYDVDDGQILLDDVDIREYNLHDLRFDQLISAFAFPKTPKTTVEYWYFCESAKYSRSNIYDLAAWFVI